MDMENTRRALDKAREPSYKKPRLGEATEMASKSNGRVFLSQTGSAGATSVPSKFRQIERNVEREKTNRAGIHQPQQPHEHQELVDQYKVALSELTFNSKPIITNLTIIAGENLHAAKAIAAIVCTNILEVPSDQKLPSLYLLDSIVKNIGRDYIRYFATRLPEVFSKAYRQVDSTIHPSMRHLFGTWKGVFDARTLQMIEKDLGFAPTIRTAPSATPASKPDPQSQRQPHGIHINPKYLESRQKLQQPDVNVQRPVEERVSEKNVGEAASYGDDKRVSYPSRPPNIGNKRPNQRISEEAHDEPWKKGGSSFPKPISGPKNIPDPRGNVTKNVSANSADMHLSARSRSTPTNWKNSDEEEYVWDDLNIKSTNKDISKGWRSENRIPDASEKMAFGTHLRKPERGDYTHMEGQDDSRTRARLTWPSKASHSIDDMNHLDRDYLTVSDLPTTSSYSDRMRQKQQSASANLESSLDRLAKTRYSSSFESAFPPETSACQHSPQNSAKSQAQSIPGLDLDESQLSERFECNEGNEDRTSVSLQNKRNLPKLESERTGFQSGPIADSLLHESSSENSSGRKTEPPQIRHGQLPRVLHEQVGTGSNTQSPFSNILSSLVAKGLISAPKTDPSSGVEPVCKEDGEDSLPKTEPETGSVDVEIKNVIGFEFTQSVLRQFHSSVVDGLFDGLQSTCSTCGVRLVDHDNRHAEWHALKAGMGSRNWYLEADEWAGKSVSESDEGMEEGVPLVPADESACVCILCGGVFEDYYSVHRGEWMFRGAVYMPLPCGVVEGPIVHAGCLSERSLQDLGLEDGAE